MCRVLRIYKICSLHNLVKIRLCLNYTLEGIDMPNLPKLQWREICQSVSICRLLFLNTFISINNYKDYYVYLNICVLLLACFHMPLPFVMCILYSKSIIWKAFLTDIIHLGTKEQNNAHRHIHRFTYTHTYIAVNKQHWIWNTMLGIIFF